MPGTITWSLHISSQLILYNRLFFIFITQMRPRGNKYDFESKLAWLLSLFAWMFWVKLSPSKKEPMLLGPFVFQVVLDRFRSPRPSAQWTSDHLSLHLRSAPWPKMIWEWNLRWHYLTYQWSSKKEVLIATHTSSVSPRITEQPLVT